MSRWTERDFPLLEAIAAIEAAGAKSVSTHELASRLGIERQAVWQGLQALADAEYITWKQADGGMGADKILTLPRLRERGLQATGQWPADGYAALLAELDIRIHQEEDVDKRSRLERLRDGVVGVGRDVAADVVAAVIKGQMQV